MRTHLRIINGLNAIVESDTGRSVPQTVALLIQLVSNELIASIPLQFVLSGAIETAKLVNTTTPAPVIEWVLKTGISNMLITNSVNQGNRFSKSNGFKPSSPRGKKDAQTIDFSYCWSTVSIPWW